jgi:hypothetical protein
VGLDAAVADWLLDGDPAIRWQVMRDLLPTTASSVASERAAVATSGWGRRLLDEQDPEGTWAQGIYSPKWTSTTYTLLLLRSLGLDPRHPDGRRGCTVLWDRVEVDGGITWSRSTLRPDVCVTAMFIALAAYFELADPRRDTALTWLLDQQLPDGGWNCSANRSGATHSSFHTTISVLEALAEVGEPALDEPASRGRKFFLEHRLYRSHRTGEVVHPSFTKLSFPTRWHYDVLRGLDHFRLVDAPSDERLDDALGLLVSKRRKDGTWPAQNKHPGLVWFDMERGGQPSRWNTLRALRVLQ